MTNNSYTALAPYYDRLNADVNYGAWVDFAVSRFPEGTEGVLDIACGTGAVTAELARRGYRVIGADISDDMLAEAKRKSDAERLDILYIRQDMRSLETGCKFKAVTCAVDSINYLCRHGDISRCFRSVRGRLEAGGAFIFDLTSPYKFANIYAGRDYILESDGVLCAWLNDFNEKSGIADFYLSLFIERPDGSYIRRDEHQRQRRYSVRYIKAELLSAGFIVKEICAEGGGEASETDERIYFVAEAV